MREWIHSSSARDHCRNGCWKADGLTIDLIPSSLLAISTSFRPRARFTVTYSHNTLTASCFSPLLPPRLRNIPATCSHQLDLTVPSRIGTLVGSVSRRVKRVKQVKESRGKRGEAEVDRGTYRGGAGIQRFSIKRIDPETRMELCSVLADFDRIPSDRILILRVVDACRRTHRPTMSE